MVRLTGAESNLQQSSFARASEDTPSSNELRVACHPKLEERRVVPLAGIEPALLAELDFERPEMPYPNFIRRYPNVR